MTQTFRLFAIAVLAAVVLPTTAASAAVPAGAEWTEQYIETPGQPKLHVDVFRPKGLKETDKTPVILSIGPYFGHGGQSTPNGDATDRPSTRFNDMIEGGKVFQRGYTVVYADLRGFGGSSGCNDFGGPGEQADTKRAVEWAASQPWSTGKVGMWGKSYDGWTQVMALDEKPKGLAAAIIQSPIIDGYRTLYQDGVHYDAGWYATPGLYQQIDAIPPAPGDNPAYLQGYATGFNPACYAQNIGTQNTTLDHNAQFWKDRDLPNARGSNVAVLWSHGFMDANTKPDNFMSVWSTLTGPKHAWFGQYDHVRGNEDNVVGRKGFIDEAMRWLDKYVKGDGAADPSVDPTVTVQEGDGKWRPENAWPPADARTFTMPLKAGSVQDLPNNDAEGETSGEYGVGIYSVSQPFPNDARLSGVSRARLDVTGGAPRSHIYALLYDVDAKGVGQLITRGAHVVTGAGTVDIELYPQDWSVAKGHRLLLLTAGADLDWYNPPHSGQTITVTKGTLSLPFLQYERTGFLAGKKAAAMSGRKSLQFDLPKLAGGAVTAQLPPALAPFPAGQAPTGGQQISLAEAAQQVGATARSVTRRKAGLRVLLRQAKLRGRRVLIAFATGASGRKVRFELRRGKKVVGRSTQTVKSTNARVIFRKRRGKGTYTVMLRSTTKKKTLLGRSLAVKVR